MRPLSEHGSVSKKRKRPSRTAGDDGGDGDNEEGQGQGPEQSNTFPGGGRKGVSSGLSIVTRRSSGSRSGGDEKSKWWKELGGRSNKSKGSIRLKTG
jgi:RNA exonuclease 4